MTNSDIIENKINWDQITIEEGQKIATMLAAVFSLVTKSCQDSKMHDVSYLHVVGFYDDNFHAGKAEGSISSPSEQH